MDNDLDFPILITDTKQPSFWQVLSQRIARVFCVHKWYAWRPQDQRSPHSDFLSAYCFRCNKQISVIYKYRLVYESLFEYEEALEEYARK